MPHRSLLRRRVAAALLVPLAFALLTAPAEARKKGKKAAAEETVEPVPDLSLLGALEWRLVGPFRGGRSTAVAGVPQEPMTFYFGGTGGGVWKTTDGGNSWRNVSDGFFATGTVGAIAVAPSDPNVVYVGMGESPVRGVTTADGDGVYRSTDGGATWTHLGLEETLHVSSIQVHPTDPDRLWVAAQGSPWVPTPERGVYRSDDGGASWEQVLFVGERAGASDLALDVTNPRVLYAAFWDHRRFPWVVESGGPGSGLHKSTDGGTTWTKLEAGLPKLMGKVGVAVSPADPDRVWALIEAEDGGLFRSDDGGKSFRRVNDERVLRARAWYYIHVFADTTDPDTVYVLNAPMMKSVDGGESFTPVRTPHGDNHDLWIDPVDHDRMINANDGGANVSFNGGETWSTQTNQPTAQFYRVATDDRFPYWLYGGQQDNTTVSIASRGDDGSIGRDDWHPVGGCESGHIAFDPADPQLVYAGCYQGLISEWNRATGQARSVMAHEFLGLGSVPKDQPYRFNWNAPILTSPHDRSVIYHAGNVLLKSTDRGVTWSEISPDLTRDEEDKQGPGGRPITREGAGGEVYGTILAVAESPREAGTIWAGSDDGLVHLTRDGGESWADVTPEGLPEAQINSIEVSPHDPAAAYLAVNRYKLGDDTPYAFRTRDYGDTWTAIADGLGEHAFVRVIREDPERRGLLYAGTERGFYLSFDDGASWQKWQSNLPIVPITDLSLRQGDLVASTQGRAFWILDDLSPLRQLTDEHLALLAKPAPAPESKEEEPEGGTASAEEEQGEGEEAEGVTATGLAEPEVHLFAPRTAYLGVGGGGRPEPDAARNPRGGVWIHYLLGHETAQAAGKAKNAAVKLEILDAEGAVVRTVTDKDKPPAGPRNPFGPPPSAGIPAKPGLNRWAWNVSRDGLTRVPDLFVMGGQDGYTLPPGDYTARLTVGETIREQPIRVDPHPKSEVTAADYAAQQALLADLSSRAEAIHRGIRDLRALVPQIDGAIERSKGTDAADEIGEEGKALKERIDAWVESVAQTQQSTFQDVINFPNKLNAELLNLIGAVDGSGPPVNEGARREAERLGPLWEAANAELTAILDEAVPAFNALVAEKAVPAVAVPAADEDG